MEISPNKLLEFVKSRRSIRNFIYSKIYKDTINDILEFGRWAPSGNNNQPWRVHIVIHETVKNMLSPLTKYGGIIENAYLNFVIFLDLEKSYDRVKDIQAIGAFMENILLGVHAHDLGGVWLGEILNQKEKVNEIFKLSTDNYELMGVIAVGEIDEPVDKRTSKQRERRPLDDFVEWY
ncbi:MAG: nitroreductase family protein [Promethearchaeota archaeon]|nr:MAG: nitroreductase family protein [Candidatus Lokiarchaeota archaeon]